MLKIKSLIKDIQKKGGMKDLELHMHPNQQIELYETQILNLEQFAKASEMSSIYGEQFAEASEMSSIYGVPIVTSNSIPIDTYEIVRL